MHNPADDHENSNSALAVVIGQFLSRIERDESGDGRSQLSSAAAGAGDFDVPEELAAEFAAFLDDMRWAVNMVQPVAPTAQTFTDSSTLSALQPLTGMQRESQSSIGVDADADADHDPRAACVSREFTESENHFQVAISHWLHDNDPVCPAKVTPSDRDTNLGRYTLRGILGRGGMATVYLAHDSLLMRDVALKIPHVNPIHAAEVQERFHREALAAAAAAHEGVCPIIDIGVFNGTRFITMPYLQGVSLADLIGTSFVDCPVRVAGVMDSIARTLGHVHRCRIVHRDIKPGNIIVMPDGRTFVTDFGLARIRSSNGDTLTQPGNSPGTPAFMAPEQLRGDVGPIGPATDIYGLGVVLYTLLTGRLPFSRDPRLLLAQPESCPPLRPALINRNVNCELESLCLWMMETNSRDRPESMQVVRDVLRGRRKSTPRRTGLRRFPAWRSIEMISGRVRIPLRHAIIILGCLVTVAGAITIIVKLKERTVRVAIDDSTAADPAVLVTVGTEAKATTYPGDNFDRRTTDQREHCTARPFVALGPRPPFPIVTFGDTVHSGLQFLGNQYVTFDSLTYDGSRPLTIEAIVTPAATGQQFVIGNSLSAGLRLECSSSGYWSFVVVDDSQRAVVSSYRPVEPGRTVHIAGTFDGSQLSLFINGQQQCVPIEITGSQVASPLPFTLGAPPGSGLRGEQSLHGVIHTVRISDHVRYTDDFEVPTTLAADAQSILAAPLTERDGHAVADQSSRGHHGRLHSLTPDRNCWLTDDSGQPENATQHDPRFGGRLSGTSLSAAGLYSTGCGLHTELFTGYNFENMVAERLAFNIDHMWVRSAPDPRLADDSYSIRWTGWLRAPIAGEYQLVTAGDDGLRVWIGDQIQIDDWDGHWVTRHEKTIRLPDRPVRLRVDYFEENLAACVALRWVRPGSTLEEPIPPSCLFHDIVVARAATLDHTRSELQTDANLHVRLFPNAQFRGEPIDERWYNVDRFWTDDESQHELSGRIEGFLRPPVSAAIPMRLITGSCTARLWIDDKLILNRPRQERFVAQQTTVDLNESGHRLRIEFTHKPDRNTALELRWQPPDSPIEVPVPPFAFVAERPQ